MALPVQGYAVAIEPLSDGMYSLAQIVLRVLPSILVTVEAWLVPSVEETFPARYTEPDEGSATTDVALSIRGVP